MLLPYPNISSIPILTSPRPSSSCSPSQIQKGKRNLASGLSLKSYGPPTAPHHPITFRGSGGSTCPDTEHDQPADPEPGGGWPVVPSGPCTQHRHRLHPHVLALRPHLVPHCAVHHLCHRLRLHLHPGPHGSRQVWRFIVGIVMGSITMKVFFSQVLLEINEIIGISKPRLMQMMFYHLKSAAFEVV